MFGNSKLKRTNTFSCSECSLETIFLASDESIAPQVCINPLQVHTLTGPILKENGEDATYGLLILCVEKESYHKESG